MERLKFYADTTRGERNKFFCFSIASRSELDERLDYWIDKGFYIRAAWHESINEQTGERTSKQIDMMEFCENRVFRLTKRLL
jgi:hypothetical protein